MLIEITSLAARLRRVKGPRAQAVSPQLPYVPPRPWLGCVPVTLGRCVDMCRAGLSGCCPSPARVTRWPESAIGTTGTVVSWLLIPGPVFGLVCANTYPGAVYPVIVLKGHRLEHRDYVVKRLLCRHNVARSKRKLRGRL